MARREQGKSQVLLTDFHCQLITLTSLSSAGCPECMFRGEKSRNLSRGRVSAMSNHNPDPIDTVTSGRNEGMQTRASGPLGEVEPTPASAPFPCAGDRLGILVMKPSRRVKTSFEYFQQLLFSALFQPIFCRKWVSPEEPALSPLGQAHGTHWHQ